MEAPSSATVALANGAGTVTIPPRLVKYFGTLQSVREVEGLIDQSQPFTLPDSVTEELLKWIIDALAIYEVRPIKEFDELYQGIYDFNRLSTVLRPDSKPLLSLFGDVRLPTTADLSALFELITALDYLEVEPLLTLVIEKVEQLLREMPSIEFERLVGEKEVPTTGLPLTPYYQREQQILDFINQSVPPDVLRVNPAVQKYIKPITTTYDYQLFLKADGLYEHWRTRNYDSEDGLEKSVIPGKPLLIASGDEHSLCLTSTGLYGRGDNMSGQLGLGRDIRAPELWMKVEVDGEVLLLACGSRHTLIYTTTGLYGCGNSRYGQLGFESRNVYLPTQISVNGLIRNIYAGIFDSFILTTTGLYACGNNRDGNLGVASPEPNITRLTLVQGLTGIVLSVAPGNTYTAILTTTGLHVIGSGSVGQLGLGTQITSVEQWTQVPFKERLYWVEKGDAYSMIVSREGVYGTGYNHQGQLAVGDRQNRFVHTSAIGLEGVMRAMCCALHNAFILTTEGVFQSGRNEDYPLAVKGAEQGVVSYLIFVQLAIDMGYVWPTLSQLQCAYCQAQAKFIARQSENTPVCSKQCLYSLKKT